MRKGIPVSLPSVYARMEYQCSTCVDACEIRAVVSCNGVHEMCAPPRAWFRTCALVIVCTRFIIGDRPPPPRRPVETTGGERKKLIVLHFWLDGN